MPGLRSVLGGADLPQPAAINAPNSRGPNHARSVKHLTFIRYVPFYTESSKLGAILGQLAQSNYAKRLYGKDH